MPPPSLAPAPARSRSPSARQPVVEVGAVARCGGRPAERRCRPRRRAGRSRRRRCGRSPAWATPGARSSSEARRAAATTSVGAVAGRRAAGVEQAGRRRAGRWRRRRSDRPRVASRRRSARHPRPAAEHLGTAIAPLRCRVVGGERDAAVERAADDRTMRTEIRRRRRRARPRSRRGGGRGRRWRGGDLVGTSWRSSASSSAGDRRGAGGRAAGRGRPARPTRGACRVGVADAVEVVRGGLESVAVLGEHLAAAPGERAGGGAGVRRDEGALVEPAGEGPEQLGDGEE